jgi:hypothetical protein
MSIDPSKAISQLVGGARGRLLEAIARMGRPFSIRQWAERAEIDHKGAASLLREFEALGLVRSEKVGSSISYKPVADNALLGLLRRMLMFDKEIQAALEQRAEGAPEGVTLGIFGSFAAGRAKEGSDLDVLVIVDPEDSEAVEWVNEFVGFAQRASGMPVNPLRFTPKEWESAVAEDALIVATIQDRHCMLVGDL